MTVLSELPSAFPSPLRIEIPDSTALYTYAHDITTYPVHSGTEILIRRLDKEETGRLHPAISPRWHVDFDSDPLFSSITTHLITSKYQQKQLHLFNELVFTEGAIERNHDQTLRDYAATRADGLKKSGAFEPVFVSIKDNPASDKVISIIDSTSGLHLELGYFFIPNALRTQGITFYHSIAATLTLRDEAYLQQGLGRYQELVPLILSQYYQEIGEVPLSTQTLRLSL